MIAHNPVYKFNSIFAPYIRDYLELKEAMGEKTILLGNSLRQFDRYCCSIGVDSVVLTEEIVNDWLATKKAKKPQLVQQEYRCCIAFQNTSHRLVLILLGRQLRDIQAA